MRMTVHRQLRLVPIAAAHAHAHELAQMSAILDSEATIARWVREDLLRRVTTRIDPTKGRVGMTGEQVLRSLIIKQMNGYSYEELAFHLADSSCYRSFCRIGVGDRPPTKARLQKNIKRIRAETWQRINRVVVRYAQKHGIESGRKVRTDCTVVESNIHHPTDSSLLNDCVRVLVRLQSEAHELFGFAFSDHTLRAKRRTMGILNAKTNERRVPLYRELLAVTEKTRRNGERVAAQLDTAPSANFMATVRATAIAQQLRHYGELTKRVIDQAQRRVLCGEQVPASEKVVSIFEPHTDVIVKDRRETLYGHKICLTAGASGLITDVVVEDGNPADSTLAVQMIQRQQQLYGRAPRQVCFDGGFTSKNNLAELKALGVEDVAFSKRAGIPISDMTKSSWVYRRLRDFRAGIEGTISFIKRVFGLDRCTWSGLASFKAYVAGSVLACNLLVVARHFVARV
jgi:IS5 family transposase